MNHDEILGMMAAYLDDELPGSERKLLEGHVAGCATCRAELAAMSALQRQVRKTLKNRAEMAEAPAGGWAASEGRLPRQRRDTGVACGAPHTARRSPRRWR